LKAGRIGAPGAGAVHGLGQGARHGFQLGEIAAVKEVRMTQASAFQAALEQGDGIFLADNFSEGHGGEGS
jgi:hypothetical protein